MIKHWELHSNLLRYGEILKDVQFNNGDDRIRIISYQGKIWYDHMYLGNIIECHELKPAKWL